MEFSKNFHNYGYYDLSNNQRILIFVMEQTNYNTLKYEISKLPREDNFFLKISPHSHWYNNYYVTSQDSMTSIWTMFSSQILPFEAYTTNWNKQYGYILEEPNLVDFFNYHNYTTKVAASIYDMSLLLGIYDWNKTILLKRYPESNFICINHLEYQRGCEDKAIIQDVKKELSDVNQFFFQELIFGHGEDYMKNSKQTRVEYYNDYFNEIYSYLTNNSLLENTTIVIVSDHGDKGYFNKGISHYKIPLIVYNLNLKHQDIDTLYTPLSFKDIILSYLGNNPVDPINETIIVGQTGSNEVAYINSDNQYFTGKIISPHEINVFYNSFSPSGIKIKSGELLTYRELIENKSQVKNYYCTLCDKNNIKH